MLKVPEYEVLKLFSLQKNQVTIFILKMVLEGVPSKGVKVVKKYCLIFPFTQYPGLLLTAKKKKKKCTIQFAAPKYQVLATSHRIPQQLIVV